MANNPKRGAEAGSALERLSHLPGFENAVKNSSVMGALQEGLLKDPMHKSAARELLKSRFMQSNEVDSQTKKKSCGSAWPRPAKATWPPLREQGICSARSSRTVRPPARRRPL
jgi:hypothetical protein